MREDTTTRKMTLLGAGGPPLSVGDEATTGTEGLHAGMIVAGKFALVRALHEDATTCTFEAEDTLLGRRVALRVLRPEHATNADAGRNLRRDARAAMLGSADGGSKRVVFEVGRRSDGSLYAAYDLADDTRREARVEERTQLDAVDSDFGEIGDEDVEEVEVLDLEPDADEPAISVRPIAPAPELGEWLRSTAQVASEFARSGSPVDRADSAADAAQRALRLNALDEAVVHAALAIADGGATGELLGQLHLVRTMAELWLGRYEACERAALATLSVLPAGATGWYAAAGHLALARARLGRFGQRDGDAAPELPDLTLPGAPRASSAHVIAACRIAVGLMKGGDLARARAIVRVARERSDATVAQDLAVHAWIDVTFAERAAFVGDLPRELPRRISALERFTAVGDVRNACEQRGALGAVLLRLGAFEEAERTLHEALGIAEPMRLATSNMLKAYLALAAFRQGEGPRALSLATEALAGAQARNDRYTTAQCHAFLALVRALGEDHARALAEADAAVNAAEAFPALRAHALGIQAATLLVAGRTEAALDPARRAMSLVAEHGGAGEGESIARLSHALVLAQTGDTGESRRSMKAARDRVVGLAERLGDKRYKKVFIERISENARILQLGAEWLDAG
ncbi:MAG: hypothetical protein HOW73_04770 [Polyangiaceae bacterium]|nr:hypothetical protein [Polyangiaceae bacterium]